MQGDGERAKAVFDRLNPILHSADAAAAAIYQIEPYVIAGDIGGTRLYVGRGGWSWYTGAAAWTWRLAVEHILGIRMLDGKIMLAPCLPPDWLGFRATIRQVGTIEIDVKRGPAFGISVNGSPVPDVPIAFPGTGQTNRVVVTLAGKDIDARKIRSLVKS